MHAVLTDRDTGVGPFSRFQIARLAGEYRNEFEARHEMRLKKKTLEM
jgi:hypothetical protein